MQVSDLKAEFLRLPSQAERVAVPNVSALGNAKFVVPAKSAQRRLPLKLPGRKENKLEYFARAELAVTCPTWRNSTIKPEGQNISY